MIIRRDYFYYLLPVSRPSWFLSYSWWFPNKSFFRQELKLVLILFPAASSDCYIYDSATGYYYDPLAGTYYDPTTQVRFFYFTYAQWFFWIEPIICHFENFVLWILWTLNAWKVEKFKTVETELLHIWKSVCYNITGKNSAAFRSVLVSCPLD